MNKEIIPLINFVTFDKDDNLIKWGEQDSLLYVGCPIAYLPQKGDLVNIEIDEIHTNFDSNDELYNGTLTKKNFLDLFHCTEHKYHYKNVCATFRVKEVHFVYNEETPFLFIEMINVINY